MNVISFAKHRKARFADAKIEKTIRELRASGIDGMFPLGSLVERCRNPHHEVADWIAKILKDKGLMLSDGGISDSVRRIVLSKTAGGTFFD